MSRKHRWEELLPEEFFEEMNMSPIAYWSCGPMEEHGLHMGLGNDWITPYEICLRTVEITGGIVFPPVPFAPAGFPGRSREELRSGELELYPPSLWVSRELCEELYMELTESIADMGFKVCIALGGHAPAGALLRELEKKHKGLIGKMLFSAGSAGAIKVSNKIKPETGGHGGMCETSELMAIRPDWVDLARAESVHEAPFASQLKKMKKESFNYIKESSAEYGEKILTIVSKEIASQANSLLNKAKEICN